MADGVGVGADLRGSLDVHINEDVVSGGESIEDGLLRRAVVIPVDARVFEEVARRHATLKFRDAQEVIVAPIHLAGSGLPRGAGDGIDEVRVVRK